MKIEQIYTGCIAQAAYYLESNGEAAIFDPLREVQPYLDRAKKDNAKIKYIFETHFHADFVSGHLDLAQKSGGEIVFGPTANPEFKAIIANDNQEFKVGNYKVKAIHTPGHTLESTCYLLIDENGKDYGIITGDTLFIGDVGRPDLAQALVEDLTQEKLAAYLFDSLRNKIMPLADDLIVFPSHGAGSACGKNMMKETVDTLGHQKEINYALNQPNKEAFVHAVLDGLAAPPSYFGANVAMNKMGYNRFEDVLSNGLKALDAEAFELTAEESGALIIDTRPNGLFAQGFIPQSINIGVAGDFAPWVGALIGDVKLPLLIVAESGKEEEVITRLSRVGFDLVVGYLEGGIDAWRNAGKELDTVHRITAIEFAEKVDVQNDLILDVRKEGEYAAEHVENAYLRPLASINEWIKDIQPNQHFFMHCAGGYRSMIAASILKARGYHNFTEVEGGFNAIAKTPLPRTDFICQSKMLKA
jgi:glyoxylase-like metal-dependent hydrolase (beta-lactamase superfamily II)/rhodanese-related sulfurtransferase